MSFIFHVWLRRALASQISSSMSDIMHSHDAIYRVSSRGMGVRILRVLLGERELLIGAAAAPSAPPLLEVNLHPDKVLQELLQRERGEA